MTIDEHAARIHKTVKAVERAVALHHAALAAFAAEHGRRFGLSGDMLALAVVPKDPPPNPE